MAVDETWTITMQTPLGERTSSLALKTSGSDLSGTQSLTEMPRTSSTARSRAMT